MLYFEKNYNMNRKKEIDLKIETACIVNLVIQLRDISQREAALVELCKKRENFPDLAIFLWFSPTTVTSL